MKHIKIKNKEEEIIIPIPTTYSDCKILIRSDYFRYVGRSDSLFKMYLRTWKSASFALNFWLRLSSYKGWFYPYSRFRLSLIAKKYGLQIYPSTKIGYGLYIGHGFGTIVNPTAIIGNNVNLSQFTTIGSNEGDSAVIGDNVYIGPSVSIVENVLIGSNTTIGAGAVVVKDVPRNSTVAGVPAKVISYKQAGRYIMNRWTLPQFDIID
jgi:serine O-acetyltransferase